MITAALVVVACALAASDSEAAPPAASAGTEAPAPERALRDLSVLELEDRRRALLAERQGQLEESARAELALLEAALVRAQRIEPVRRWRAGKRLSYEAVRRLQPDELLALYVRASLELELDGFDVRLCERVQAVTDVPGVCAAWRLERPKPRLSRRDAATVEKIERALASALVVARCGEGAAANEELARIRRGEHPRAGLLVERALTPASVSSSSPWPPCTRG